MATYKKGFKKQTSEQMLLQVIVGVIIAVIVFVLIAFVYDIATRVPEYSDYTKVEKYEDVFTQEDESENPIEKYMVYFYFDECEGCSDISKDVLKLANRITKNGGVFMVANTTDMTDKDTNLDDFLDAIEVTTGLQAPLLVTVVDGEPAGVYVGTDAVVDALTSVKEGTYEPFN
ncbi:MAG: hypothetical protein WC251_01110 [Candidatus Izemoplasmatales bacterium]|jgi:hypothetical protein|nr:hypothetical protein [Candidatus Izemoplasmatales bacterium]